MNALTTQQGNALQTANPYQGMGMLDPAVFDHMQRVGKVLALSPLFPEHLRKGSTEQAIANGILVINMAIRLREDPLTVSQAIYFVGGKPGWSASYMIAKANQHGVFKNPIDWEITGSGPSLSVTAVAELSATGKKVSATCDMAMAKSENWTKNSKYQSMPEQMLRYRSATFLIRLYCPEVMVGLPSQVEIELPSMRDVTPIEPQVVETEDEPQVDTARAVEREKTSAADNAAREAEQKKRDDAAAAEAAKAAAAAKPKEPEQSQETGAGDEEPGEEVSRDVLEGIVTMVMRDMKEMDSKQMADEVLGFYENQIAAVKKHAPDLWAQIEAAYETKAA